MAEAVKGGRIGDFFAVMGGDIEGVHGHAFFGADPGMGGVEVVLVDGEEQIVKQSDAVERLDLDGGASRVQLVADVGLDRDGDVMNRARREVVGAGAQQAFRFVGRGHQLRIEAVEEPLAGGGITHGFKVGGAHAEDVDDDAIAAGEKIRGQDVEVAGG